MSLCLSVCLSVSVSASASVSVCLCLCVCVHLSICLYVCLCLCLCLRDMRSADTGTSVVFSKSQIVTRMRLSTVQVQTETKRRACWVHGRYNDHGHYACGVERARDYTPAGSYFGRGAETDIHTET